MPSDRPKRRKTLSRSLDLGGLARQCGGGVARARDDAAAPWSPADCAVSARIGARRLGVRRDRLGPALAGVRRHSRPAAPVPSYKLGELSPAEEIRLFPFI